MRLGILGGSFNPIHHGHLVMAERARETLRLDRLLLLPTWLTPLKSASEIAPPRDRLNMIRLAVRGNRSLEANDLELRRRGVSYTVDTLRKLARPEIDLYFVIGSDSLGTLSQWRSIREIARLCTFAIAPRPNCTRLRVPKYIRYRQVSTPLLEISGTEIRERVSRGLSIRYLVPESVEAYIRRKRLYRT